MMVDLVVVELEQIMDMKDYYNIVLLNLGHKEVTRLIMVDKEL